MKRIAVPVISFFLCQQLMAQEKNTATDSFYLLSPVEVKAIRAGDKAPFTKTNIGKKEIEKNNLGQDVPFLLNQTPSVVINSDAGNGIGYTGIRIRGSDATRINVTVNGIPYNDAESQGTFFVDLPDIASSVNSIQIQRGVGTSSNGTGAFGATVSLSTNEFNPKTYAEINNSYGSFNTWKNTVKAGTGLINNHFTVDARLSQVTSDGYIDRSKSNLQSFYLSGVYTANKSALRFNVFSGKEKTYQAWNGVPENLLKTNRTFNSSGTDKPGEPYDNETDNYRQTHYQLFFNTQCNDNWSFNTAAFLTRGLGYYENYKGGQKFSSYNLPNVVIGGTTITKTDLIRQKWLDNYFYGQVFSAQYKKGKNAITIGSGWTVYDGNHHGNIIWAQYGINKDYQYYDVDALKSDINVYGKWQYDLSAYWSLFTDLQYRQVQHKMNGFANNPSLLINRKFHFVNPKAGISYSRNGWQTYFSYAMAGKEPNRDDFEASPMNQPKKETLHDFEAGIEKRTATSYASATLYYMLYKDQLVLTGMINDVGAYTRINVPNSYRAGIELQGGYTFSKWVNVAANLTFSRNKIKTFTEFLDNYDASFDWIGQQDIPHKNTDIAFAPSVIGGLTINFLPVKNIELSLLSKYVGKQYLDNTQNESRKLDAFYTQDTRVIFSFGNKLLKDCKLIGQVNNIFNKKYEPNGYTYSYVYDGTITADNYYFPMAGTNYMIGLNIRL
ncbi:MAG: TonB-dependent receptor plug domain-containing protein [Chitinophagaceae bacterium]